MAQDRTRRVGQSTFGGGGRQEQGVVHIQAGTDNAGVGVAGKGAVLAIDGVGPAGAVTTHYFFVTAAGVLRVASAFPADTESDGSAV